VFAFDTPEGFFYGFPVFDAKGLKVAQHQGREVVSDPSHVDRGRAPGDFAPLRDFLRRYVPAAGEQIHHFTTCLYTMTPDQHFVVDRHPGHENVVFAAGFNGHGFKFAPVAGSVLADLALKGRTSAPVGFFSAGWTALSREAR
jgi:sarcosine oxidase